MSNPHRIVSVSDPPWTPSLVIFDVFNTLVRPEPGLDDTFAQALRRQGIEPTTETLHALQAAGEKIEHYSISESRGAYVAHAQRVLADLAASGISPAVAPYVVGALEQLHQAPMQPLPGVIDLLRTLRASGVMIAVCSNWSWDLDTDLARCGLLDLLDVVMPSARAGCRKPHPAIYRRVLAEAGVSPAEALFVGDSYTADVAGPHRIGIPAVHLRPPDRPSPARWCIADLAELLPLLVLPRDRK